VVSAPPTDGSRLRAPVDPVIRYSPASSSLPKVLPVPCAASDTPRRENYMRTQPAVKRYLGVSNIQTDDLPGDSPQGISRTSHLSYLKNPPPTRVTSLTPLYVPLVPDLPQRSPVEE